MNAKNFQFNEAVSDAQERVARDGYANAAPNDVMWVGFGYLAEMIRCQGFVIRVDGKKWAGLGFALGAGVVGAIMRLLHLA